MGLLLIRVDKTADGHFEVMGCSRLNHRLDHAFPGYFGMFRRVTQLITELRLDLHVLWRDYQFDRGLKIRSVITSRFVSSNRILAVERLVPVHADR
jgi:putative component of toxin-antitoxin plasmid stabilization module